MLELLILPCTSPRTTVRTWHLAVAYYSEAVHLVTLLTIYTFAVRSVCQGLHTVKVYESYHRLFICCSFSHYPNNADRF
jgi:hypothetical protein